MTEKIIEIRTRITETVCIPDYSNYERRLQYIELRGRILELRYNHNHDEKGRFCSGRGGGRFSSGNSAKSLDNSGESDIINTNQSEYYPESISDVKRGNPMTFDEADHMSANPNFKKDKSYKENCQTCVVAYEARLRGYDVEANPMKHGSMSYAVSLNTRLPWIDPETGKNPEYIFDKKANNPKLFKEFLEKTIEPNQRYTMSFARKYKDAHIISADRTEKGKLRLYDPQNGKSYTGLSLSMYLKGIDYYHRESDGLNKAFTSPQLLRVDNMNFDLSVVNKLLKGK